MKSEDLIRALHELREPPPAPLDDMWTAIGPAVRMRRSRNHRFWIASAVTAAAASALLWTAVGDGPRPPLTSIDTPLGQTGSALMNEVELGLDALPATTAATTRNSLSALNAAIRDVRSVLAASPGDHGIQSMLDGLERQRFDLLQTALGDIAVADQLALVRKRGV